MYELKGYRTRREIESIEPSIKPGSWTNLIKKAKIKKIKMSIRKGRLRHRYSLADVKKIIIAAKNDKRCFVKKK